MCNLYALMVERAELAAALRAMADRGHNRPPQPSVYPDQEAPVVVVGADGQREIRDMRWGMPSSGFALQQAAGKRADAMRKKGEAVDFAELLRKEPDKGTTNVRNTISKATGQVNKHWGRWLGPANRCLVPFTSFAEPDQDHQGTRQNIWFALDDSRPLACFAGIWTPHACVRVKSRDWEELEVYAFLTTESAEPVKTYHAKAMPVILTDPAEQALWLTGSWDEVKHLQRPLPDRLKIVGQGGKSDPVIPG